MKLLRLNPWFFVLNFLGLGIVLSILLLVVWAQDEGTFRHQELGDFATQLWLLIFKPSFAFMQTTGYENLFFLYFLNHILNVYLLNVALNVVITLRTWKN